MKESSWKNFLQALFHIKSRTITASNAANSNARRAQEAICAGEKVLKRHGIVSSESTYVPSKIQRHLKLRSWDEVLLEAKETCTADVSIGDLLDAEDIRCVETRLAEWNREFEALTGLNNSDYIVAGIAGLLAGLADVFLVQVPKHPGFLGSSASHGGWLSNALSDKFSHMLPADTVSALEQAYKVPYDPCTNAGLATRIPGLGPRTHRMQSLGHDPLLGWIFGVRDILSGQFTAIGSDGRIIVQSSPRFNGETTLAGLASAFQSVGGHMLSDVATPAGLPPPLFALTQIFQSDIQGHAIADITRGMYRSGYDFRHFLAGGVCVALIEVVVRFSWVSRELQAGKALDDAIPSAENPKLNSMLLLAHAVGAMVNAGKVSITSNPLSLSWAQWLAFFAYLLPQVSWVLAGKHSARLAHFSKRSAGLWSEIGTEFSATFAITGSEIITLK